MVADLVGKHPALRKLRHLVPLLGAESVPLVITGEEGVGKFLVASHVHLHSRHHGQPIAVLNASTLDERDQRTMLLGGEPALLTTSRKSILERPTTVVLKHVAHLRPHLQDDLAEALVSQKLYRPGSTVLRYVSCRIIITTGESLVALKNKDRLTARLFEVLKTYKQITVPPLRKRAADIPLLAAHFLLNLGQSFRRKSIRGLLRNNRLDPQLESLLKQQRWQGNVMQLKTFMRSLVIHSYHDLLNAGEYQEVAAMIINVDEGREFSLEESMHHIQQAIVSRAIERCGGNIRKAGQLLGMTESAIHRRKTLLTPDK